MIILLFYNCGYGFAIVLEHLKNGKRPVIILSVVYVSVILPKTGLVVSFAKFPVHGGDDSLNLPHGKHSSKEAVACIISALLITQHCHSMVYPHRQTGDVRILRSRFLLFLEYAGKFNKVCPAAEVGCLCEVTVREDKT